MEVKERRASLTRPGADDTSERSRGFRAVGVAVAKLAAPVVKRRGGGVLVRLKSAWPVIVGADWAGSTWPAALGRGGVLKLYAVPAAALELQHRAPLLIERVNRFLGREAVTRLALVQALPAAYANAEDAPAPTVSAVESKALDQRIAGIEDPTLRAALARLGRAVMAARG
jgi:hypothetical protein